MFDAWALFAVIALFYILEGLWWAPSGVVCFSRGLWGRFKCSTPLLLRRDAGHGLILPRHVLAGGYRFLACPLTLAISPDGIASLEGLAVKSPPFIPYEDVGTLRIAGARLLHQGKIFANAASPAAARQFLQFLQELATLDSQERASRITESIDGALSHGEVRRRMRRLRWAVRKVEWLPLLIFANLFILAPTYVAIFGLSVWPVPVALHIVLSIKVLVVFLRTTSRLLPKQQEDRFATSLMLLLFPPATARYMDLISRDLLSGLHPLAVAAAVLDRAAFRRYARYVFLEIQTERTDDDEVTNRSCAVENWFSQTLASRIMRALECHGLTPEEMYRAPRPESGAASYCPRCHAQYRSGFRECIDCERIALVPHHIMPNNKK